MKPTKIAAIASKYLKPAKLPIKPIRTLSEEFHSCSPDTQRMIKFHVVHTPTSKYQKEYTNIDRYQEASVDEKRFMENYGLVKNIPK